MNLLSGKEISKEIYTEIRQKLSAIDGKKPKLTVVLVGSDPASLIYVKMKEKKAEEIGLRGDVIRLPSTISQEELHEKIDALNNDPEVNGILIQLPLPTHLDSRSAINRISPVKDVDGLHTINIGKLHSGEESLVPCTPLGIVQMLERSNVKIEGAHAVIVGRSDLVGKPIARLLEQRNATVTICHSRTRELAKHTKSADILVVAIGKPNIITAEHIKENAVVIDVGINRVDGKLVGDVEFESASKRASLITPVPGGVGPMTICMLMYNTLVAYKMQKSREK